MIIPGMKLSKLVITTDEVRFMVGFLERLRPIENRKSKSDDFRFHQISLHR